MNVFEFARIVELNRAILREGESLNVSHPCSKLEVTPQIDGAGRCANTSDPESWIGALMDDSSTSAIAAPTSVYKYFDEHGTLIYVGITKRSIGRQAEHTTKEWWPFVVQQEIEHYADRQTAATRESDLIRSFSPPFNKVHNRDHAAHRNNYLAMRRNMFTGTTAEAAKLIQKQLALALVGKSMGVGEYRYAEYVTDPRFPCVVNALEFPPNNIRVHTDYGGVAGSMASIERNGPIAVVRCVIRAEFFHRLPSEAALHFLIIPTPRRKPQVLQAKKIRLAPLEAK
jgi:hypothetical protein